MKKEPRNQKIIAVVPAYNEEATIQEVLQGMSSYVSEIVVVNDGSQDKTAQLAQAYATVVSHEKNKGYDAAIDLGFKEAAKRGADIIITTDADGQHNSQDMLNVYKPILNGEADVVIGVRKRKQRAAERLFAWYTKKKVGVVDPLCGMKAYRRLFYDKIGFFDSIGSTGTQLMFNIIAEGGRIQQVPIALHKREDKPRFGGKLIGNLKIIRSLLKIVSK